MPVRTNLDQVRTLLGNSSADAWTQITMASEMVDTFLLSQGLTAIQLKQIEAYLACHLYQQTNPAIVRESYGGATFEYNRGKTDSEGLCGTKWGQMATLLDTSGTLRNLGKMPVRIEVF